MHHSPGNSSDPAPALAPTPATAAPPPDGRLGSLDAFRGACALAVFLTHWFLWANFRPAPGLERTLHDLLATAYELFCQLAWNSGGQHPAVLGFFVLSGFCIHAARARSLSAGRPEPGWRRYFLARARRILPVYWWGALLGLVFVGLHAASPTPNPMLGIHASGDWGDFLVRLTATTALVPGDVVLGNWTLNTVSTEIAIYALYPALLLATRRLGWPIPLLLLIGAQFLALTIAPHVSPYWLVNTPLVMALYWYVGMLAAGWHYSGRYPIPGWVALSAWALFLLVRETPDFVGRYVALHLVRCLGFALLLLWLVGRETRLALPSPPLVQRVLGRVGLVSYSLYAVHTPVIMAVTWAMPLFGCRSNSLQLLLTLVACAFVTLFTYRFIEKPFLRPAPVLSSS